VCVCVRACEKDRNCAHAHARQKEREYWGSGVHLCVYVCISACMCVYVCVCACMRVSQRIQSMQLTLTSAAFSTGIFIIFCSLPDASTPSPSPLPSSHSMKRAGLTPVCVCLRLCACVHALAYAYARACARFNCTAHSLYCR